MLVSNYDILRDKVYDGLKKRYGEITKEVQERTDYELSVIHDMGFDDYFLILDKVRNVCMDKEYIKDFCNRKGFKIPKTGYINMSIFGRGSGIGTMIAYGLNLACIDPIKYDLYFDRFLNKERVSMPDFDYDVSRKDRQLLLEVLNELFPYVANIGTTGTMGVKGCIKDIGKTLGVPFQFTNSIAKKLSDTDGYEDFINNESVMNEFYNIPNVDHEFYLKAIQRINGLGKSSGIHAGGVVLCGEDISSYIPCRYDKGRLIIEPDMHTVEDVGFVKNDFLGLKTLDVLAECEMMTKVSCFDITQNLDDEDIYADLRKGKTLGVFQFEGDGTTKLLQDFNVSNFEDLALCNALYRPSGLDNVFEGKTMLQHAIDRKNKKEAVVYLFPEEKEYLSYTYGLMAYQEQIMRRVQQMTGCSLGKADIFRRAVGKKDEKLLAEQLDWFVETAFNYRFTESPNWNDETWRKQVVLQVMEDIKACGRYCFNKSHACGYSAIGYCCAYYAHHYPEVFYSAMLNNENDKDGITMELAKLKEMGFTITSPDVNESGIDFTPVGLHTISFGLSTIKNMGKSAEAIVEDVEKRGRYSNLYDLLFRLEPTQCNKSAITALAKAGALDNLTEMNRCTLVKSIDNICKMRTNRMKVSHRKSGDYKASYEELMALVDKNDKKIQFEIIEAPESKTIMANYENESMGYFISCTPLDDYKQEINRYNAVKGEVAEVGYYVGIISSVREIEIKKGKSAGKKMAFVTLSCLQDTYDITVFNGIYEADYENIIQGNVVVIKGRRNEYNGNVSVVAEYIRSININGIREVAQAHLYLDMPLNPLKMNMLKNVLNDKMVGDTGVYFHVPNGDKDIAMYIGNFSLNNFVISKLESCGILKYGLLNG